MKTENKYIYKHGNSYRIKKNGENFGTFRTIETARKERDLLIYYNWDWDALCDLGDTIEETSINLKQNDNDMSYIYQKKNKKWITYYVVKRVQNKIITFSKHKKLDDAKKWRDYYIKNNWDLEKCLT